MNKLLIVFLLCCFKLSAYIECQRLNELLPHINKDTLVVFNINNVLTVSCQDAGSTPWAEEHIAKIMAEKNTTKPHATNLFIPLWHDILIASDVELFDPDAEAFVKFLQNSNIKVMALTNRYTEMGYPTHRNLRSVGIDFAKNPPYPEDFFISGVQSPAKYIEGIIFNGLINFKGDSLVAFLKQIDYYPEKVIYVEDKPKHLAQVENALADVGINCLGVHFGALDLQRQGYRKELAELQVKYHFDILDDSSAQRLVNRHKIISVDFENACHAKFAIKLPRNTHRVRSWSEIVPELAPGSIVVTELDHTVWDTNGTVGSRMFLDELEQKYMRLGYGSKAAKDKAEKIVEKVHRRAKVHLIEEEVKDLIKDYPTHAISFRPERLIERTKEQARELELNFASILCGKALEKLEGQLASKVPGTTLVAISSNLADLYNLEELANKHNLQFQGFFYQNPQSRKDLYNQEAHELQLELLDRLLTNEEAEYLLTNATLL